MLLLVRHGETAANAAGLLLGTTESELTERGRAQVTALGRRLGGVSRLISSPLGRARESAALLGLDVPVEIDDRWVEIHYGEFEGESLAALPADLLARWRADPSFRPPGGETLVEVGDRVGRACDELFSVPGSGARSGGHVVVVSHVSPIKAAVGWTLGVGDTISWKLHLSTASLTRVAWGVDGPVLQGFNATVST